MNFITGLALVLLTLVGYSSGSVLGATGRTPVPGLADLLVVLAAWIVALSTRSMFGKWGAIGVWLVLGLILGMVLARIRIDKYPESPPREKGGSGLWGAWKDFSRRMGNYQSRVLMAFAYFTVVLPFGLGTKFLGDPLRIKRASGNSNWQSKDLPISPSLDEARRQF